MADPHAPTTAGAAVAPHAAEAHGHGHDAHDVAKHVKGYLVIGAVLILFTGITVALSYVNFGSNAGNIIVAMIVATFKAALVAAIFMHLKGERITIWRFLFFTAFFVSGLFLLTYLHFWDPIAGISHGEGDIGTWYNKH